MFENKTFETLREEVLDDISDDIDKVEGSIIYDATTHTLPKIAEFYSNLDVFFNLLFADTSDGEYLARRTAEFGVYKKLAAPSIRKGVFRDTNGALMNIPIGSRFSLENITFQTTEKISVGEYRLQAETVGTEGNNGFGAIIPLEPISNLGTAEITDVLIPGTNDELDPSLYNRFQIRVQKQATSGNAYHYEQWALSIPGVGAAKVIPVWNGPNTVKVILLSSDKTPVTQGVVDTTYNHIESEKPIGATVTVLSATNLPITVTAKLTLAPGATLADIEAQFKKGLSAYLQSIAFVTNPLTNEPELIRYTRIANVLLDIPPIIDYSELLVNGGTSNIQPTFEQVGVIGAVTFT